MGKLFRFLIRPGIVLIALVLGGCEKPQLQTDDSAEPDAKKVVVSEEPAGDFQSIRKSVIGRSFKTLTLGSRQFENALVEDITDGEIVIRHDGGVEKVPWSEVPGEVREKWGYRSGSELLADQLKGILPKKEKAPPEDPSVASAASDEKPKVDREALAAEIRRQQQMLNAQLVGIRSIESDLQRHTLQLNELRRQLNSIRALQSARPRGGVVVAGIEGRSTLVDRKAEAREVQGKMKLQEDLVAQFVKSLEAANSKYQAIQANLEKLQAQ